jgi:hypothetical protein
MCLKGHYKDAFQYFMASEQPIFDYEAVAAFDEEAERLNTLPVREHKKPKPLTEDEADAAWARYLRSRGSRHVEIQLTSMAIEDANSAEKAFEEEARK